ncbi:MAG: hypothetical protein V1921_02600 [Candidatus Altiarchaeota archaeon]
MKNRILIIGIIALLVLSSPGCLRKLRGGQRATTIVPTTIAETQQAAPTDEEASEAEPIADITSEESKLTPPDVDLDLDLEPTTTVETTIPEVMSDEDLAELDTIINNINTIETELYAGDLDLDISL